MNSCAISVLVIALVVGCAGPTPTPTRSSLPTLLPSPAPTIRTTLTATATSTAPPTPTPTPIPTLQVGPTAVAPGSIVAPFASGFSPLTFVTNAGDGSGDLYALEQVGRVVEVTAGGSVPPSPWLDLTDRISSGGERGLLGLAFHPAFKSNGRFFVDYTNLQGNTIISELTQSTDGTVDPAAERVLLEVDQPFANHNGGMLAFGPDGYLYIGLGDGGSAGDPQHNGQSLQTLLGKILRIDVDIGDPYGIPSGNPFQGAPGETVFSSRPEIWDWGLRNPWRFSFDSKSGGLFIGDVGQDLTEEVDVERAGLGQRNYGWNIMEGDHCYGATTCTETGLTLPVATYPHADGCAVTGGYVYRGTKYPDLDGRYFYADDCSGRVWSFAADTALGGDPVTPQLYGQVPFSVSSFGEDEAGELYIVDFAGAIYSLVGAG